MNWKSEAVDKLRQYEAKKLSIVNIPLEISRLESAARGIRSAASDGTPVSGGGSGREDMLLSNIVHREELERSLEQAQKWVALMSCDAGNFWDAICNEDDCPEYGGETFGCSANCLTAVINWLHKPAKDNAAT